MADKRRRRREKSSEDSEELSEESGEEKPHVDKESDVESEVGKHVESEYESAEEEEEPSDEDAECVRQKPKIELQEDAAVVDQVDHDGEGSFEDTPDIEVEGEFFEDGDLEEEGEEEEGEEEEDYVEGERQQGDGEESSSQVSLKEKVLDDDEDRRNPQYIPKKGSFYEHDDRVTAEPVEEEKKEPKKKKKLWHDEGKWFHDMFREEEQVPKSREELVTAYGYDIRSEDGPPRARRRRRYGSRGVSKYTRSWQDEEAYFRLKSQEELGTEPRGRGRGGRIMRGRGQGRGRGRPFNFRSNRYKGPREDIVPEEDILKEASTGEEEENDKDTGDHWNDSDSPQQDTPAVLSTDEFPALPSKPSSENNKFFLEAPERNVPDHSEEMLGNWTFASQALDTVEESTIVRTQTFENSKLSQKVHESQTPVAQEPDESSVTRARSGSGWRRGDRRQPAGGRNFSRSGGRGRGQGFSQNRRFHHDEPYTASDIIDTSLSKGMEKLGMKETKVHQQAEDKVMQKDSKRLGTRLPDNTQNSSHQEEGLTSTTLKGSDSASSRPKRYSSLRQRSLPETSNYQPTTQTPISPQYYKASFQPPAIYASPETIPTAAASPQATSPPLLTPAHFHSYTPNPYQEIVGMRAPLASPPRIYPAAPIPAAQPVVPGPYIAPSCGIMNYTPAPAAFSQYPLQQFTPPPPPPPPVSQAPPQEIYRGGITYYNTHSQQQTLRMLPQKRPKAAIPILPPPEAEGMRLEKQEQMRSSMDNMMPNDCLGNLSEEHEIPVDPETVDSLSSQPIVEVES